MNTNETTVRVADSSNKLCKDCKYCLITKDVIFYCWHPQTVDINLVTGASFYSECQYQRSRVSNFTCTKEGKFFEQRPPFDKEALIKELTKQ